MNVTQVTLAALTGIGWGRVRVEQERACWGRTLQFLNSSDLRCPCAILWFAPTAFLMSWTGFMGCCNFYRAIESTLYSVSFYSLRQSFLSDMSILKNKVINYHIGRWPSLSKTRKHEAHLPGLTQRWVIYKRETHIREWSANKSTKTS